MKKKSTHKCLLKLNKVVWKLFPFVFKLCSLLFSDFNYVLNPGTKNFKTTIKTDLEIARPLLQSMHKMHRAGVDNYVTHNRGRIRKLTPKECLRLMGFRDDFKQVVSDTQMYRQAGDGSVVDVYIALMKQMDITKYVTK